MDFKEAISSIGELLFEYAISIILIPRTLIKVLIKPVWALDYLTSSNSENVKLRYEKYSNPVLFWIVIGILPYFFIINGYFQGVAGDKLREAYNGIGTVNVIGGLALFLVSFPLSCAFILHLFKYKGIMKTAFKRSFYIQLYLTAPVLLFYIPVFFIDELPDTWAVVLGFLSFGIIIWFLFCETFIIKKELGYHWLICLCILVLMYLMFYIFAAICCLIFFLINIGHFQKLVSAVFDGLDTTSFH